MSCCKLGTPIFFYAPPTQPRLHAKDAEPGRFDRSVKRGRKRQRQSPPRFPRRDNAVVPEPSRRVIGRSLGLVFCPNWRLERFLLGLRPLAAFSLEPVSPERREH